MNVFLRYLAVIVIPVILMVQFYQGYRYTTTRQRGQELEELQKVYFEENKKILASIAVYSAPARIYRVATEILGLKKLEPNRRLLINLSEDNLQQNIISEDETSLQELQDSDKNVSIAQISMGDNAESGQ